MGRLGIHCVEVTASSLSFLFWLPGTWHKSVFLAGAEFMLWYKLFLLYLNPIFLFKTAIFYRVAPTAYTVLIACATGCQYTTMDEPQRCGCGHCFLNACNHAIWSRWGKDNHLHIILQNSFLVLCLFLYIDSNDFHCYCIRSCPLCSVESGSVGNLSRWLWLAMGVVFQIEEGKLCQWEYEDEWNYWSSLRTVC